MDNDRYEFNTFLISNNNIKKVNENEVEIVGLTIDKEKLGEYYKESPDFVKYIATYDGNLKNLMLKKIWRRTPCDTPNPNLPNGRPLEVVEKLDKLLKSFKKDRDFTVLLMESSNPSYKFVQFLTFGFTIEQLSEYGVSSMDLLNKASAVPDHKKALEDILSYGVKHEEVLSINMALGYLGSITLFSEVSEMMKKEGKDQNHELLKAISDLAKETNVHKERSREIAVNTILGNHLPIEVVENITKYLDLNDVKSALKANYENYSDNQNKIDKEVEKMLSVNIGERVREGKSYQKIISNKKGSVACVD